MHVILWYVKQSEMAQLSDAIKLLSYLFSMLYELIGTIHIKVVRGQVSLQNTNAAGNYFILSAAFIDRSNSNVS